jgi:hypothetical protein
MSEEIQRADLRLRHITIVVVVIAALAALASVVVFQRWLGELAATLPTDLLIAHVRRWIGVAATACSLCVLLLAGHAAVQARRVNAGQRWPVERARVLRDTVVRRGEAALRIGRLLDITALVLVMVGVATALLSWRLFST